MNRYQSNRRSNGRRRGGSSANSQIDRVLPVPDGLMYYCRTCQQILDYKPANLNENLPKECTYKAKRRASEAEDLEQGECDIVYGTERSIKRYFRIKDEKFDAERIADEEKASRADKL